ncbi:MAG: metallophosphoesterase [Chitinophagaceae bacterium]|nr:metallophosphoesterase [Chitinophagaceae bacterium]
MRTPLGAFIFIAIILLLDTYAFQAVKSVTISASSRTKAIVYTTYWAITALVLIAFVVLVANKTDFFPKVVRSYIFAIIVGLFLAKLTTVFFILIDDVRRLFQWIVLKIVYSSKEVDTTQTEGITRSVFLSWLGIAAGTTLFGSLINGFRNKYNYHINRVQLSFDKLPAGFRGLKIVQISDIHSGSFTDTKAVHHGVQEILKEKADIILFTGDLVNDMATEMEEYLEIFSQLKAPMGVYSTLGNHDYGDYIPWPQKGVSKEQNLENLKKTHASMGWRLLMNEHVALERNGDKIALLGIENWSNKARFPKHGRMDLAHKDTEAYPFKILMSHDPSHWEAQVQPHYPDVDLMLSGHTHGMQFGVDVPGFKWSPVQYMYKQWAGLYENEKQKLYVNRGFGFIGYPGRVGILPEITVIELV